MCYIKLHRTLLEWSWCDDPLMLALWIHILLGANNQDGEWHGAEVKRGQMLTSVHKLSIAAGLTERQARVCLDRLVADGLITKTGTNRWTMITICNYDDYDCKEREQVPIVQEPETESQPPDEMETPEPIPEPEPGLGRLFPETEAEIAMRAILAAKKDAQAIKKAREEAAERIYALYPGTVKRIDGNRASLRSSKDKEKIERMLANGHTEDELAGKIKRYLAEVNPPYTKMLATFLNNLPDNDDKAQAVPAEPVFSDPGAYIGEDGKVHTKTLYPGLAELDAAIAQSNRELNEWRKLHEQ